MSDFNNYCDLAKVIIQRSGSNPEKLAKKMVSLGAIRVSLFWHRDLQQAAAYKKELFDFNSEKILDSGRSINSEERLVVVTMPYSLKNLRNF